MTGKPRRWRRRLLWLLAIALALRLLLALLQPWLLGLAGRAAGVDLSYRACSLSLLGGSVHLEDVVLRDPARPADAAPLLQVQDLLADLSTWQLLRGRLVVVDAALGGVRLELTRGADGSLQLPAAWQASTPAAAPAPATAPTTPVHFDLPLQIASARASDVRVRLVEANQPGSPVVDALLDVDLADLGRTDRDGTFAVRLHEANALDHLLLQGTVRTLADQLAVHASLTLRGLRPGGLAMAAADHALLASVHTVDAELSLDVTGRTRATAPRLPELAVRLEADVQRNGAPAWHLTASAGPLQPRADGADLAANVALTGPDLGERLELTAPHIRCGGEALAAQFALRARGVHAAGVRELLAAAGVHLPDRGIAASFDGELTLRTQPDRTTFALDLRDLTAGTDEDAIAIAHLGVVDLVQSTAGLTIGAITVDAPRARATATRDGLLVAGITFAPPPATPPTATPTAPATPTATTPLPLRLQQLTLRDGEFAFADATQAVPATLAARTVTLEGKDLAFAVDAAPGSLHLAASLPSVAEQLTVDVTSRPNPHGGGFDLRLLGTDVTAAGLAPWLQPLGIEPALRSGRLTANATATVAIAAATTTVDARLADLRFTDGDEVLLRIRNTVLSGLQSAPAQLTLAGLQVDEPFVAVHRNSDGSTQIAGLRFAPAPATPAAAASAPPAPAAAVPPTDPQLGPIEVRSAAVRLHLPARSEPLDLSADLTLDGLRADRPTAFHAALQWHSVLQNLTVDGTLQRAGERLDVTATLAGSGLHGEGLTDLLPPTIGCPVRDGALAARVQATITTGPQLALDLLATDVALRDQGAEVAAVDRLELRAPQVSAERVQIAALRARGVRAVAASTDQGLQIPGLLLRTGTAPAPASAAPTPPSASAADTEAATAPPPRLPDLALDDIELQLERLVWRERRQVDGEPVTMAATLKLAEPWQTAAEPMRSAPLRWQLTASAAPLVADAELDLTLRPYEPRPELDARLRVRGIDTTALAKVAPSLADRVRGTLAGGELDGDLHAVLGLKRRDPRVFDLSRPFGAEVLLENLVLRTGDDALPLASLDAFEVIARAYDPRTGDLLLRTVELDGLKATAQRTEHGLELLGLELAAPPTPPDAATAATAPVTAEPTPAPAAADGPSPEVRIDRLHLQGIELTWSDATTSPPTLVPIQDVDFELLRFSTRAFTEPLPFAFSLQVRGGDVPLERRVVASSLFAGILSSAVSAVTGGKDKSETEPRPLLDELSVRGRVQLVPQLTGQVRATLSSLELPSLRGLAKGSGIDIGDGLADMNLVADLRGPDGIDINQRTTFTWLSLSEPPGGPISTYLKLPAPLDTVLFALRNDVGEQRIPLHFTIPAGGMSRGAVANAGVEALVKVLGDAVTGAAFRATGMLTGALGITANAPAKLPAAAAAFSVGTAAPVAPIGDDHADEPFAAVLGALADPGLGVVLSHELSAADLARAAELANPPATLVAANVANLRADRATAIAARERLAVPTAALYAAGRMQDALASRRALADLDARLGRIDAALDEALGMLGAPNRRAALRRTRRAAEAMATARLEAVARDLVTRLGTGVAPRIEIRPPKSVVTEDLASGGQVVLTVRPHVE